MGRRRSFTHSFVHFFIPRLFISFYSFIFSISFISFISSIAFIAFISFTVFHSFIPSFLHSFLHCEFETPVMRFVTGSCCRIVACWRFPFTRHSQTICALLCRLKIPIASLQGLSMLKVSVFVLSKLLGFGCIEFQSNVCQRCHQLWFFCCIHPRPCRWNLNGRWRDFWAK